jgi:hypothetical protein
MTLSVCQQMELEDGGILGCGVGIDNSFENPFKFGKVFFSPSRQDWGNSVRLLDLLLL